jgi:hypothetical protein
MAVNFPDSPSNGDTHVVGGVTYTYNSTKNAWETIGGAITTTGSGDTPPANPADGDLWFNSSSAELSVRYNDGTSSQWVAVSGAAGPSGSSPNLSAVAEDILPDADSSRSLGSASKKWKDLFLSGDTISLGSIKLKDAGGSLKVETSAGADVSPGGTKIYANLAAFPDSGNAAGDIGFATDTKASYMWDGVAWQRISIGSQIGPRYTTAPTSQLSLEPDGTTSTITAVAVDETGFPVTYDWDAFSGSTLYNDDSLPPQLTALANNNGVFTLTPSTVEAKAGNFSFRVKASDGVLVTPAISSVSLAFETIITIAARQTRSSNYVEPTSTGVTLFNCSGSASGSNYNYFPEGTTSAAAGMTTGKRYIEAKYTSQVSGGVEFMVGVSRRGYASINHSAGGYGSTASIYLYGFNGRLFGGDPYSNNVVTGLSAFVVGDVAMIAYDTDAEKVWLGKNGTWSSVGGDPGNSGAGISLSYADDGYAFVVASGSLISWSSELTWGGSDYTKPTGFSHF